MYRYKYLHKYTNRSSIIQRNMYQYKYRYRCRHRYGYMYRYRYR